MISRSLWVISTMVTPRSFSVARMRKSWSVSCGVSTALGSSRIRILAPRNSTFRISTRCCSPTDRSAIFASGLTVEPVLARQPLELGARRGEAARQQRPALGAQHQVLQHGEGVDQHEMLVDHADAVGDRVVRVVHAHGLAVDADLAGIGAIEPVEDAHQRRLAGAVLADDAGDRALGDGKRHAAHGMHAAERLLDARKLDRRGCHHCKHQSDFPAFPVFPAESLVLAFSPTPNRLRPRAAIRSRASAEAASRTCLPMHHGTATRLARWLRRDDGDYHGHNGIITAYLVQAQSAARVTCRRCCSCSRGR